MNDDSTTSATVRLSDIALSFANGTVQVLKNLDLTISEGETVALTGPSGAGKTSLLAIIAGLLRPTGGRAQTLGLELSAMDEEQLAAMRRADIGVVFQHFHLLETMTAVENTALPLELAGSDNAAARAGEALDAVGLGDRLHHFPSQLSGGERQRTAIARAFSIRPKLLLADEPTGNLDSDTGRDVLNLLLAMVREYHSTLLFVTHNNEILRRFDTVYNLHDGVLYER